MGERVNPSSTGNAGRDRHNGVLGWIFVKMGQKLGKVPIKSHFQGMDGTYYAINLLQHGPINPLSPQPPPPGVWLGGWEGVTKVINGVQAQGLGPWGIK